MFGRTGISTNNLHKNNRYKQDQPTKTTVATGHHNSRSVRENSVRPKIPTNNIDIPKTHKKDRKVEPADVKNIDEKVRYCIYKTIQECEIIYKAINDDFDNAQKQMVALKVEIQNLSHQVKINDIDEILGYVNIDFTNSTNSGYTKEKIKKTAKTNLVKIHSRLIEIHQASKKSTNEPHRNNRWKQGQLAKNTVDPKDYNDSLVNKNSARKIIHIDSKDTPKKQKKDRKVKPSHVNLNSNKKVRDFIFNIIKGCEIIHRDINVEFDKVQEHMATLKGEIEHLSNEVKINDIDKILGYVDFTKLEGSKDIKEQIKTNLNKTHSRLIKIHKKLQGVKYINYKKPAAVLLLRFVAECFRSMFRYITNKIESKSEQDDHITEQSQTATSTEKSDDLAPDGVGDVKPTANYTDKKPVQTGAISRSPLENYRNTCWLNSSLKLLTVLYGDKIKKRATELLNKITIQEKKEKENTPIKGEKSLYKSILELFNKLDTHKDASTEVKNFLRFMFIYGREITNKEQNIPGITTIYQLIINMGYHVEHSRIRIALDASRIKQWDASEFVNAFIDFMGIGDKSNSLEEIYTDVKFLDEDLLKEVGIVSENPKIIKINQEPKYPINMMYISDNQGNRDIQEYNITKGDLRSELSVNSQTYNISKDEKENIVRYLADTEADDKQPLVKLECIKEFTANLNELNTVTVGLATQMPREYNKKNVEGLKTKFKNNYPHTTIKVLNSVDNQEYEVTAKAVSFIAHQGESMTSGHYIACSVDDKNRVIVHDDTNNHILGKSKKLEDFLADGQFTPVVIGYKVVGTNLIPKNG